MNLNAYYFGAANFIGRASEMAKPRMQDDDALLAVFLLAVGIERLLKGILYDINPVFVLNKLTFNNTFPLLSPETFKTLPTKIKPPDLDKSETDVISMSQAITRCRYLSRTVSAHESLLRKVNETRDIIAHRRTIEVDRQFVRPFLIKEFRPFIMSLTEELGFPEETFFRPLPDILSLYFDEPLPEPEEDISVRVQKKLRHHLDEWSKHKEDANYVKSQSLRTKETSSVGAKVVIACPACGNESVLSYEPDFDYSDGQVWIPGVYATKLECFFCGLSVKKYDEIDQLQLNDVLNRPPPEWPIKQV